MSIEANSVIYDSVCNFNISVEKKQLIGVARTFAAGEALYLTSKADDLCIN